MASAAAPVNIDEVIDRQRFWGAGVWIVAWAIATMIADGFDLLSLSYVAPGIIERWNLTPAKFAVVFSWANFASMAGGIVAGYFADRLGRKGTLIVATLLLGASTLGTALATSLNELLTWRTIAGLGIGAVPPIAIVMVNECAPRNFRATLVSVLYLGTTIGNLLAASVAAALIAPLGWQIMFIIGGIVPLVICGGVAAFMPESLRFLVARRPHSPKLPGIAARFTPGVTYPEDTQFITTSLPPARDVPVAQLFTEGRAAATLLFWGAYFASGFTLFSLQSWWPIILRGLGLADRLAFIVTGLSSLVGWMGGLIITRCMDRFGLLTMTVPPLIGCVLLVTIGHLGGAPAFVIAMVCLLSGAAYSGGHTALHATGGLIYPTEIRANGVAWGLVITRLAGVIAPLIVAGLLPKQGAPGTAMWAVGLPLAVVAACYLGLSKLNAAGKKLMKITDVTLTLFTWDGLPKISYGPNIKLDGNSTLGLVSILTDQGITGHSFLGGANRGADLEAKPLIDSLKPLLMGENPLDRERLYHRMFGRGRHNFIRSVGALDVALWDLAGKIAGMPIHQLMGSYRSTIPAYASSQSLPSVEAYCEQALHFKSLGWQAYKIHPPHPWKEDIKVCEAVRKAVGDGYPLMLDATWSYDVPSAVRVGRAIEELDFYWLEDPLTEWNIHGYQQLKKQLHVPLMATELPFAGLETYAPWIMGQATDFLRGDVAFKGGLTTCLKTAHLAEAFGMNYEIHHGSNSLANVACLHLAMAIRNCEYFEVLLPDEANKFGLVQEIEVDSGGLVHAPMAPGLGVEIDFERIRRNTQVVLR